MTTRRMPNRTLSLVLALGGVVASLMLYAARPSPTPTVAHAALAIGASRAPAPVVPAAAKDPALTPLLAARSPELARLDARRELYESVDALLQASEFAQARRLLDDDQARFGDDDAPPWRDLGQSYRLIADCLEHPTAQLRSRAQAFVLVSEAQRLEPRILSACRLPPR
jgi:hypothetical protein